MNTPRLRFRNLAIFWPLTEEFLDGEFIVRVIYGFCVLISFPIFFLGFFLFLVPQEASDSIWGVLYITFMIFFIPFAQYCVGAYGPGLLRKLLYRTIVRPKLKRIYRENHEEMQGPHRIESRGGFCSRLKEGYSLTLHSLKEMLSPTPAQRGYVMPLPDIDDTLSLHDILSNEEQPGDTSGRGNDRNATEEGSQAREQLEESRESRENARRNGAKFGSWIGLKVKAAFDLPLEAAIRLGELSTKLGDKAQAMRLLRLQRERRQDLPGDISLP